MDRARRPSDADGDARRFRDADAQDAASPGDDPEAVRMASPAQALADADDRSTRDRLLDAAMELFHANGYNATGVSAILRRAEVNSGSLYHYFPTKEDLLLALLERYRELLWPLVIEPVFDRVSDPIERIFGVLEGYRQMLIATECGLGCPIGNLALELSDALPAARRLIAENFEGWRLAIRACLDDAADRLPPDTDRDQLATFVLTTMEGGVMQSKAHRMLDPFEASVVQLRNYFDRLLEDGRDWSATDEPPPDDND